MGVTRTMRPASLGVLASSFVRRRFGRLESVPYRHLGSPAPGASGEWNYFVQY
jgi:hypothetical protein